MMILQFIKDPKHTGSLISSSKYLAMAMTKANIENAKNIVEIGPGAGVFTKKILQKKSRNSNFFVMEINPNFVKILKKKFPNLDIENQNANNILKVMKDKKIDELDVVISGLPWAIFSSKEQDELLKNIYDSLKKDGEFLTFAYAFPTINGRKFRRKLYATFKNVRRSKVIWKNLPPAYVYHCTK